MADWVHVQIIGGTITGQASGCWMGCTVAEFSELSLQEMFDAVLEQFWIGSVLANVLSADAWEEVPEH